MVDQFVPVNGVVDRGGNAEPVNTAASTHQPSPVPQSGTAQEKTLQQEKRELVEQIQSAGTDSGTQEVSPEEASPELSRKEKARIAASKAIAAAKKNREMLEYRDKIAAENRVANAEIARLRQEVQRSQEFQQRLQQDPYNAVKQLGLSDKQIMEKALREGSPERAISLLQEKLEEERANRIRLEKSIAAEKQKIEMANIEKQYLTLASNENKYPHLANVPPRMLITQGRELLLDAQRRGLDPNQFSNEDVLEALDSSYESHIRSRKKTSVQDKTATQEKATQASSTKPMKAGQSRTLTNRMASTAAPAEIDISKMSEHQQRRELARQLEAAQILKRTS